MAERGCRSTMVAPSFAMRTAGR